MRERNRVLISGLAVVVFYLVSLCAILFSAAGRVDWPMGWAALGIYATVSLSATLRADPELLRERLHPGSRTDRRDALLAIGSLIFLYPLSLLVAGIDNGRFGWSPPLPPLASVLALAAFAMGKALALWAILSNRFFSTFVRLQQDRGHVVVSEGPYRYIRHPGYAGTIVSALALPLALGSLWALLPAIIGAGGFVLRTALEDRTLLDGLEGYGRYARVVRYRLFPGLW